MALIDQVRATAEQALIDFAGSPKADEIRSILVRLDGPLRVAIAGRVKAGKSTLLNALVGEELAPTNAGECTKVITWYQDGPTYRVTLFPEGGSPLETRFTREHGALEVDLGGHDPAELSRMVVDWPSASLRSMTLIDTPGIASMSADVAARTHAFLAPDDDTPTQADAVLYLLRHLHGSDVRFLEAFHDDEVAQATPINAIGVLSRADEVGVGRLDALEAARRIAGRYRSDPQLRRLCQTVIPVAGLLAQAGVSFTEAEFRSLRQLAELRQEDLTWLLLSVDRFVSPGAPTELIPLAREGLLDRLGIFGVRLCIASIQERKAETAAAMADLLRAESGIDHLRDALLVQFAERGTILKARSALLSLEAVAAGEESPAAARLGAATEAVAASAHEFAELRLLNLLRTGGLALRPADLPEAERLLGAEGLSPVARLGAAPETPRDVLRSTAMTALEKWQRRAENPLATKGQTDAARVIIRSCESVVAATRG